MTSTPTLKTPNPDGAPESELYPGCTRRLAGKQRASDNIYIGLLYMSAQALKLFPKPPELNCRTKLKTPCSLKPPTPKHQKSVGLKKHLKKPPCPDLNEALHIGVILGEYKVIYRG